MEPEAAKPARTSAQEVTMFAGRISCKYAHRRWEFKVAAFTQSLLVEAGVRGQGSE